MTRTLKTDWSNGLSCKYAWTSSYIQRWVKCSVFRVPYFWLGLILGFGKLLEEFIFKVRFTGIWWLSAFQVGHKSVLPLVKYLFFLRDKHSEQFSIKFSIIFCYVNSLYLYGKYMWSDYSVIILDAIQISPSFSLWSSRYPVYGGTVLLRNGGTHLPGYMVSFLTVSFIKTVNY